jgi:hypothetical protein
MTGFEKNHIRGKSAGTIAQIAKGFAYLAKRPQATSCRYCLAVAQTGSLSGVSGESRVIHSAISRKI